MSFSRKAPPFFPLVPPHGELFLVKSYDAKTEVIVWTCPYEPLPVDGIAGHVAFVDVILLCETQMMQENQHNIPRVV